MVIRDITREKAQRMLRMKDISMFFDGLQKSKHFINDPYFKKIANDYEEFSERLTKIIYNTLENDNREFINNYPQLFKNVAFLQVVSLDFFRSQADLIHGLIKNSTINSFHQKAIPALL